MNSDEVEIKDLIIQYKSENELINHSDEIYKWELVAQAQKKWDMDVADFAAMLTSIDFKNLIYHMSRAVLFHIAKERPEELREVFRKLFDEKVELAERMKHFRKNVRQLYDTLDNGKYKKDNTYQDERAIATYLTFYYPNKYTFYQKAYYKKITSELTNRKFPGNYIHYLQIVEEFKDKHISRDNELLKLKEDFLSRADNPYPDPENNILAQDIIYTVMKKNPKGRKEVNMGEPEIIQLLPYNLILYGPPGTGKTYSTKAFAISLAENGNISDKEKWSNEENRKECLEKFDHLKSEGRVEFVTFHQSFSYEDFVQGFRPDVMGDGLKFNRVDGIFKKISDRARENYELSIGNRKANPVSFDKVFQSFMKPLNEGEVKDIPIQMQLKSYKYAIIDYDPENGRIKFRKKSGGIGHDLLEQNIKSLYEGKVDLNSHGLRSYYYPLLNKLIEHAQKLSKGEPQQEFEHFVLIIDEINRANISRVLGELITLLEPDKRLGGSDELIIKLPSGEDFAVPPNLHIIGTMNTADKSIAHLDVALRRRFRFIGVYPNHDLARGEEKKAVLSKLNDFIIREYNADLCIGHSYFMDNESLQDVMNVKVIPLLSEYFNHDADRLKAILDFASLAYEENTFKQIKCTGIKAQQNETAG